MQRRSERRHMTQSQNSTELDGEDLACLGFRRADDFMDVFADLNRQALHDWVARLPKPPKPRKPTLDSVAKNARKAGIEIARYELKPDGTVVVITGISESSEPNPWRDDLRRKEDKR
jgi:hypothetical protein